MSLCREHSVVAESAQHRSLKFIASMKRVMFVDESELLAREMKSFLNLCNHSLVEILSVRIHQVAHCCKYRVLSPIFIEQHQKE